VADLVSTLLRQLFELGRAIGVDPNLLFIVPEGDGGRYV
jgi:hypothetical protein